MLIAGLLAFVILLGSQSLVVPSASASTVGGAITRDEVLARAQFWVDQHVPYSGTATSPDPQGLGYRTDCSGMVSMAWHIGAPGLSTQTLDSVSNMLGSYDNLQPGDILIKKSKTAHTVIFKQWTDASHTTAWIYQQPDTGKFAELTKRSRTAFQASGYVAYSYKNIVGSPAVPAPEPAPTRRAVFESASNTGWAPLSTGIASDTASVAMTMDGVKYLYTVINGYVYEAASNTGWQNLNTGVQSSGALSVMSLNGVKLIYTAINGYVHEAASNTGWQALNTGIPVGSSLAVMTDNGNKLVYTVAGGQVYEAASSTGWQNLNTGVPSSGPLAVMMVDGVRHVYTVNGGKVYEAAASNGWQALNSGIATTGPLSVMTMGGVKYVYTVNGGNVYEAASNAGWQNLNTGIDAGASVSVIGLDGVKIIYSR